MTVGAHVKGDFEQQLTLLDSCSIQSSMINVADLSPRNPAQLGNG